jgi:hypothetical protein
MVAKAAGARSQDLSWPVIRDHVGVTNVARHGKQENPSSRSVGASPGRERLPHWVGSKRLPTGPVRLCIGVRMQELHHMQYAQRDSVHKSVTTILQNRSPGTKLECVFYSYCSEIT